MVHVHDHVQEGVKGGVARYSHVTFRGHGNKGVNGAQDESIILLLCSPFSFSRLFVQQKKLKSSKFMFHAQRNGFKFLFFKTRRH